MDDFVELAFAIAKKAHAGQFDKGGNPYISHPAAVSSMVESKNEKIVAFLHDVVEDSKITLLDLRQYGFNDEVLEAVRLVTKNKDDDYFEYLIRIKQNSIAKTVKLADLTHNMDITRLKRVDILRLAKYKKAYEFLTTDDLSCEQYKKG